MLKECFLLEQKTQGQDPRVRRLRKGPLGKEREEIHRRFRNGKEATSTVKTQIGCGAREQTARPWKKKRHQQWIGKTLGRN